MRLIREAIKFHIEGLLPRRPAKWSTFKLRDLAMESAGSDVATSSASSRQNRLVTIVPSSEIADWSSTDCVARLTVRSVSWASV